VEENVAARWVSAPAPAPRQTVDCAAEAAASRSRLVLANGLVLRPSAAGLAARVAAALPGASVAVGKRAGGSLRGCMGVRGSLSRFSGLEGEAESAAACVGAGPSRALDGAGSAEEEEEDDDAADEEVPTAAPGEFAALGLSGSASGVIESGGGGKGPILGSWEAQSSGCGAESRGNCPSTAAFAERDARASVAADVPVRGAAAAG
jgi:hypothetical protein